MDDLNTIVKISYNYLQKIKNDYRSQCGGSTIFLVFLRTVSLLLLTATCGCAATVCDLPHKVAHYWDDLAIVREGDASFQFLKVLPWHLSRSSVCAS